MTQNADTVRRYQRRVLWLVAAVLVLFGVGNLVSPIGNRWTGGVMLTIGLLDLVTLRWLSHNGRLGTP